MNSNSNRQFEDHARKREQKKKSKIVTRELRFGQGGYSYSISVSNQKTP